MRCKCLLHRMLHDWTTTTLPPQDHNAPSQLCPGSTSFDSKLSYPARELPGESLGGEGFQEWVLRGPSRQQVWGKQPDDDSEHSREWGKPLQGNVQYAGHTQAASISKYSSSLE